MLQPGWYLKKTAIKPAPWLKSAVATRNIFNPCEVIHEGERREVLPLEALEEFFLDGVRYEAFSTSGGIGSLCETLESQVQNLNYKTVRYPGHRDIIKLLTNDLNLCARRDVFKDIIKYGVPMTEQDVVVIFVTVKGNKEGGLHQETYAKKIYGGDAGEHANSNWSAIQLTTATAICAIKPGARPHCGMNTDLAPSANLRIPLAV
jgi:saccharopine dehydrogenase-like NADP-dependent oxidoreductase